MFGHVFLPRVLMDIADMPNRAADRVVKGGTAAHLIIFFGQRHDFIELFAVVQDFGTGRKEYGGDVRRSARFSNIFSVNLFCLGEILSRKA